MSEPANQLPRLEDQDFFSVQVAANGNHQNQIFKRFFRDLAATDESTWTSEKRDGVPGQGKPITTDRLREIISLCNIFLDPPDNSLRTKKAAYLQVRDWIRQAKRSDLNRTDLDASQVMGYLRDFLAETYRPTRDAAGVTPWMLEELKILYTKWRGGDLSSDPKRGLTRVVSTTKAGSQTVSWNLDKQWQFYKSANFFGAGHLVNGQCFYSREELMRDGAHGAKIAGISGTAATGAYSVVLGLRKTSKYPNSDSGETIYYMGSGSGATAGTRALMKSKSNDNPIRVFRSFMTHSQRGPEVHAYRFDGLYRIVDTRVEDQRQQTYSFKMVRETGQGLIRGREIFAVQRAQNSQQSAVAPTQPPIVAPIQQPPAEPVQQAAVPPPVVFDNSQQQPEPSLKRSRSPSPSVIKRQRLD